MYTRCIKPEKSEYEKAVSFGFDLGPLQWAEAVTKYREVPRGNDYIRINIRHNKIVIDLTSAKNACYFNWAGIKHIDNVCRIGGLTELAKSKFKYIEMCENLVIITTKNKLGAARNIKLYSKNIWSNYLKWRRNKGGTIFSTDKVVGSILFEIILNIHQHSYRDHSETEYNDILNKYLNNKCGVTN